MQCSKVGLSPSKNICGISFIESPLKMTENIFYLILKALFVLNLCSFRFLTFMTVAHVEKTA